MGRNQNRKQRRLQLEDIQDFIAGDAVIWGKRPKHKRLGEGWVIAEMQDQWIGRFLRTPDGNEHFHYFCSKKDIARKLFIEAFLLHRRDLAARIAKCDTYSFGLQEDWMKEPVIFKDEQGFNAKADTTIKPWPWIKPYDYEDEDGNESEFRGPYGMTYEEPELTGGPYIWLQGRLVDVGEVSDMQVDTTLDEHQLTYVEKIAMLNERKAWRDAYLSGDFDAYAE